MLSSNYDNDWLLFGYITTLALIGYFYNRYVEVTI